MTPMDPQNDPFWKIGQQQQQQQMDRMFQRMQAAAQKEQLIHKRIGHFLKYGIIGHLWKRSRTALFIYVLPFWCFAFAAIAFGLYKNALTMPPEQRPVASFMFAVGCFFSVVWFAFTLYGFLTAARALKIIAGIHLVFFAILIWGRSGDVPNISGNTGFLLGVGMFLCFVTTSIVDFVSGFRSRPQSME